MLRIRLSLVLGGLAAISAALLAGCEGRPDKQAGKVRVAATIFPLADLAQQVGADQVQVTCVVPPGLSPHGFELSPRGRAAIDDARLILSAGAIDTWLRPGMATHVRRVDLGIVVGDLPVVEPSEEADHDEHGEDERHAHVHSGPDPHYWLDPRNMAKTAQCVADELAAIDDVHAQEYRRRADEYARQCLALAEEMRSTGAALPNKTFVAEHPAWGRLADLMGLRQVASIEPVVGAAGTPAHLQELVDQLVEQNVKVIFTEPQLPPRDAQAVQRAAAERGWTVKLLELDPLGNPSIPGRETYLANMRTNLTALREGLGAQVESKP